MASKSRFFGNGLRLSLRRNAGILEKYQTKKKEDHFQKELDYFLSKPEYNLRSHNEKVGETVY